MSTELLPRDVPGMTHTPDVCAAWADEQGNPRAAACPQHWEDDDTRKARADRLGAWRDRPLTPGEIADELTPGHVLDQQRAERSGR